jgi:hypothetical protein
MSTALKCPNPSCPYLFDPSTVPPGVVLACPRCGMRFTLGNPAAAAPPTSPQASAPTATFGGYPGTPPGYGAPPGYPPAPQPGYPPHAPTYAPANRAPQKPLNPTFGDMTPETARADGEEGPRLPVRSSKLQTYLLIGVGIVALCSAGVAIWYKVTHRNPSGYGSGSVVLKDKEKNFSLEPPPKPWVRDEEMRAKLSAPYIHVYRRDEPEAYIAVGARDYPNSSPRPSDLEAGLTQALHRILERDTIKMFDVEGDKTWMGQECRGYKFEGVLKGGGKVEGDARTFGHKGVGYWFVSWTGSGDIYEEQKAMFAEARRRCALLELRKDWKEKQSPVVPFKNTEVPYTILDAEGMWEEVADEARIKAEDPKADKYLVTKKNRKRDFSDEAELVVLLLDGGANPLADARAYVEAQANLMPDIRGKNTFVDHAGSLEGDPTPNTVDGNAEFALLKSENSLDRQHAWLYAISAIKVGGKTVAVVAKCPWGQRAAFDTKFVQIVKSLREK